MVSASSPMTRWPSPSTPTRAGDLRLLISLMTTLMGERPGLIRDTLTNSAPRSTAISEAWQCSNCTASATARMSRPAMGLRGGGALQGAI